MKLSKEQIDLLLHRKIGDGAQFEKYIDKSDNTQQNLGSGDTLFGVTMMQKMILKFYPQVSRLAELLKGETLQETCINIKRFLYFNIQYDKDLKVQTLRSPASSWANRQKGIDCKSFSIFAGCILANYLGIKFAIRRIEQKRLFPGKVSHVYVVVPKNQQSPDFDEVFAIDATIKKISEPVYAKKYDLIMDKLNYVGMNAADPRKRGSKSKPARKSKPAAKPAKTASKKSNRKGFPFSS